MESVEFQVFHQYLGSRLYFDVWHPT